MCSLVLNIRYTITRLVPIFTLIVDRLLTQLGDHTFDSPATNAVRFTTRRCGENTTLSFFLGQLN